ncbi:hypothetical protein GSH05_32375 [Burkholderia pseudomallei]|uniref:restriction endonuclease n=1 Tax=Burkholderia pseudomallei TaxID=28450 RepID=UPI000537ED2F|nr:restriction endonuclease [Burkholderia pseudomallei]KGW25021.1 restriction endonuclease family protein [Burkholderia pseudomallei MSHR733]KGX45408.1 restriction endonuclease family protein [Burkholderia pseudomallei MSHR2138]MBM5656147.1 hypothetical protein [Burkholderia pseudomallei]
MQKKEFVEALRKSVPALLQLSYEAESDHLVLSRENSRLMFCVQFTENGLFTYLYFRTTSWDWDGERTDLNDFLSVLPAAFFRVVQPFMSCVLYDIEHPVGGMPGCEVYARYIAFGQPDGSMSLSEDSIERLRIMVDAFVLYEFSVGLFLEFDRNVRSTYSFDDDELKAWVERVQSALSVSADDPEWTFNLRTNPHWMFYRSLGARASVLHAPKAAHALRQLVKATEPWTELRGPTVRFFKSSSAHNAASHEAIERCSRAIQHLEKPGEVVALIPIENRLIAVGSQHVVILEIECDRSVYNDGRDAVVQRQRMEHQVLFEGRVYLWEKNIDGARFEALTRDLLSRQPGMVHVRQTSLTNEGDANADLLCDWIVASLADVMQPDKAIPFERRTIVVQCKAWARAVGKSDVPDIRDALDRHDATGILVVALAPRRSLLDHLAALRKRNVWAECWTRADIEEQLDASPDLLQKYPDVVRYAPAEA